MALPLSRDITYTTASPVSSANLNAIQDCIVSWKHGLVTVAIPGISFVQSASPFASSTFAGITLGGSAPTSAIAGIILPAGVQSSILAVRFFVKDNASGATKLSGTISKVDNNGTATTIGSTPASAGSGAAQTLTVASGLPLLTPSLTWTAIGIAITAGSAACNLFGAEIDFQRL